VVVVLIPVVSQKIGPHTDTSNGSAVLLSGRSAYEYDRIFEARGFETGEHIWLVGKQGAARSGPRFGACRFLLLAGYENLAAPIFALPQ
jgi:hypothetical protein